MPCTVEPSPGHFVDRYDAEEQIGKGSYATVYSCTNKETGELFAVKVVDKSKAGPKDIEDTTHEINMMARIGRHKNVVRMVEYFSTAAHLYIVMDLLDGGMLFDRIVKLKHYSEKSAVEVVRHVLEALAHIHSVGVIHRDLKPENLLLPHSPSEMAEVTDVCIADFGLATVGSSTVCCGSPCYIAPEVIMRGYYKRTPHNYDSKCDIWSVGVITYALLSGRLPFFGNSIEQIFQLIVSGHWRFNGSSWTHVSEEGRAFVKKCLDPNPVTRPSAAELLEDMWLVDKQSITSDIHLSETLNGIRELAQRRVRAAARVFSLATNWLDTSVNDRPPFMKYIQHPDPLSTVVLHQSQTDTSKFHTIDYGKALERRKDSTTWKIQDCCTCTSESVCRHVQNVHEYLFVGKQSMDISPFMDVLVTTCDDLLGQASKDSENEELLGKLVRVAYCMEAACEFSRLLSLVPEAQLKPNFMVSRAKLSEKNARIGRWAAAKRVAWDDRVQHLLRHRGEKQRTNGKAEEKHNKSHRGSSARSKGKSSPALFFVPVAEEDEEHGSPTSRDSKKEKEKKKSRKGSCLEGVVSVFHFLFPPAPPPTCVMSRPSFFFGRESCQRSPGGGETVQLLFDGGGGVKGEEEYSVGNTGVGASLRLCRSAFPFSSFQIPSWRCLVLDASILSWQSVSVSFSFSFSLLFATVLHYLRKRRHLVSTEGIRFIWKKLLWFLEKQQQQQQQTKEKNTIIFLSLPPGPSCTSATGQALLRRRRTHDNCLS
eukprot:gene10295-7197_t